MSAMMMMPNGQNVNLCTNEGASAFFHYSPRFVSTWTDQAKEIIASDIIGHASRRSSRGFSNLVVLYQMLGIMAESLTPEQISTLAQDQFQCLVDFIKMRFTTVSGTTMWRSSGILTKSDQELLDTVVPWLRHPMFVKLMLNSDGLTVIASLVARDEQGKPTMPDPEVTETILMITNNCFLTMEGMSESAQASKKDMLMDLERTGLLAQTLRCLTAPVQHGSIVKYLKVLDSIEQDTRLLKKKFTSGKKTGDILEGLLSGKDGWKGRRANPHHERVMKRLVALNKLAIMTNQKSWKPEENTELGRLCRHCAKTGLELKNEDAEKRLLACGKCKCTYYCSRDCQKADWKDHKKTCNLDTGKTKEPEQNIIMFFIREHYIEIMTKIKQTCDNHGIDKKDVFLQIDFYKESDAQGQSPAMEGQFLVASVSKCLEGGRSAEPNWFYKGSDVYESNVAMFRAGLQDHHKRVTANHVLVVFRSSDGDAGVYRVDIMAETTDFHILSNEALELFPQDTPEKRMKLEMLQGQPNSTVGALCSRLVS
jgi:hypothetical protein